MNHEKGHHPTLLLTVLLFVLSAFAMGQQTAQSIMPGTGAPLLVTPEIHLGSPPTTVGATTATAGNTAGASNSTATRPITTTDIFSVPSYASGGSAVSITPLLGGTLGVAPSTPEVHLGTAATTVGATTATAGNTVGAVNATSNLPVTPRATGTVADYGVAGSTVAVVLAPAETRGSTPGASEPGVAGAAPAGAEEAGSTTSVDRGVTRDSTLAAGGVKSLAELARERRLRVVVIKSGDYTNEDLERRNQEP